MVLAWEGEDHLVFFDALSGDTHLLSAFSLLLAEAMKDDSLTQAEILHKLLAHVGSDLSGEMDTAAILDIHIPRLAEVGFLLRQAA